MRAKLATLFAIVLGVVLVACQPKNDFNAQVMLLDELERELMTCTTQEKFDSVHMKITAIDENPLFQNGAKETVEQRALIINRTLDLGFKAFAVMDILKVAKGKYELSMNDLGILVNKYLEIKDKEDKARLEWEEVEEILKFHFNK